MKMTQEKRQISLKERELLTEVISIRKFYPSIYDTMLQKRNKEYFVKLKQAQISSVKSEIANQKEPPTVDLNAELWSLQKYKPNVEMIQEKSEKLLKCLAMNKK